MKDLMLISTQAAILYAVDSGCIESWLYVKYLHDGCGQVVDRGFSRMPKSLCAIAEVRPRSSLYE
jgi:hypothetical protein